MEDHLPELLDMIHRCSSDRSLNDLYRETLVNYKDQPFFPQIVEAGKKHRQILEVFDGGLAEYRDTFVVDWFIHEVDRPGYKSLSVVVEAPKTETSSGRPLKSTRTRLSADSASEALFEADAFRKPSRRRREATAAGSVKRGREDGSY